MQFCERLLQQIRMQLVAKARKRRPGGGRPPKGVFGGKTEWFSTRITPETRAALEQEVAARGHPIPQVAERLLVLGLDAQRRRDSYRPLRALCFAIERIALEANGNGRWVDPNRLKNSPGLQKYPVEIRESLFNQWRTDPFRYRAFRLAVASLLTNLEPKGEMRNPFGDVIDAVVLDNPAIQELMKRTYESPENLAAYIFANIWRELNRSSPLTESEKYHLGRNPVGQIMLQEFYQMSDARHDLGLDAEPQGGKS